MAHQFWPDKDPGEQLDYRIDWKDRLLVNRVTDSIASSTWTGTSGITIASNNFSGTFTTVWLAGGTIGTTYTVTNTIVTTGGRTMVQSVSIKIATR